MPSSTRPWTVLIALLTIAAALPTAATAETRIEKRLDLEPGGSFRIDTDAGSVHIVGGGSDAAEIVLTSRRDDLDERYDMSFESTGTDATVKVERKGSLVGSWWSWRGGDSMHFEIRLPRAAEVFVDTAGGRIEVESIDGRVDLDTSGGGITVENVRGDVLADTSGGGISVSDIEGNVNADTSGGPISASSVTGEVRADTSGGGITLGDVGGDIDADTSGGSIKIIGAGGAVRADTSGGSVRVAFTAGNDSGGSLSSSGGGVTAVVDPSVSLEIDASSSGGGVRTDLPITVRGSQSRTSLRGTLNGGGEKLRLRSSGGGVRLESL